MVDFLRSNRWKTELYGWWNRWWFCFDIFHWNKHFSFTKTIFFYCLLIFMFFLFKKSFFLDYSFIYSQAWPYFYKVATIVTSKNSIFFLHKKNQLIRGIAGLPLNLGSLSERQTQMFLQILYLKQLYLSPGKSFMIHSWLELFILKLTKCRFSRVTG